VTLMAKESRIVLVQPNTGKIQHLGKLTFSELKIKERKHLENWIINNPDVLGERLLIVSTEFDRFDKSDKRLDILALDSAGKIVIVELKREIRNSLAELQAIRYAAFCSAMTFKQVVRELARYKKIDESQAESEIRDFVEDPGFEKIDSQPRIILAAGSFGDPGLTSSVLWLRTFRLDIRCVELAPYKLPDNRVILVPRVLIPLPEAEDFVVRVEEKEAAGKTLTPTQRFNQDRNKQILSRFRKLDAERAPSQAPAKNFMQVPTMYSGTHFQWSYRTLGPEKKIEVAVHFEKSSKEKNRWLCEMLKKHRSEIEAGVGKKVTFDPEWRDRWASVYVQRDADPWTESLADWAAQKMAVFIKVVQPHLDQYCPKQS